ELDGPARPALQHDQIMSACCVLCLKSALHTTRPNRAGSTDAEVDRPQDGISENGVAHARGSECATCPGAVELGGCHSRSCRGFFPCRARASKGIERAR